MVLNSERQVADCNDVFTERLGVTTEGQEFSQAFPEIEEQLDFAKLNEEQSVSTDTSHYQVTISKVEIGSATAGYLLLFQDVTPLIDSIQEVNRHNEQLEDLSDSVAHELRNPLTVVQGYAETIVSEDSISEEAIDEYCEKIQRNTDRMRAILSDFMTTIDASSTVSDVREVNLRDEIANVEKEVDTSNIDEYKIPDYIDTIIAESFRMNLLLKVLLRFVNAHAEPDAHTFVSIVTKTREKRLLLQATWN